MTDSTGSGKGRHLAMISYDWSTRLMGGSIRAMSFAHNLPKLGWSVSVITASPPDEWPEAAQGVTVHFIPSRERRFGGGISADADASRLNANPGWLRRASHVKRLFPLERQLAWYPAFWRAAPGLLSNPRPDAVMTVVAPNVMMPLGHHLARRLGVPHHIDLRDDFADRHLVEDITASYQRLLSAYGHYYTRRATSLSVVSPVTRSRFAALGIKATLVMNGFVEEHFAAVPMQAAPAPPEGPLRLVHLGWLGDFRSIAPVVAAINQLGPEVQRHVRLEHYGLIDPDQVKLLEACHCSTEVFPQVPHAQAVEIMLRADALLAIPGDRLPAALSGKLFEYLRARRPIVLVAGEGAARELGEEARIDVISRPDDVPGLVEALSRLIDQKRSGTLKSSTDPEIVATLERGQGARILARLLDAGVSR